jgi:hypothetical protein
MVDKEKREQQDRKAKIGFDLQDFIRTEAGSYLTQALDQKIALTLSEMGFAKIQKGERKGEFMIQTLPDFERARGFALGIQWVLELFNSRIGEAKRIEKERRAEEKEQSKT